MKKMFFAIFASVALSFAAEECNTGSYQIQAPLNSCINTGYVCLVTTGSIGDVQFTLGKDAACSDFETTKFKVYPLKSENELDMDESKAISILMPYLIKNYDPDPHKSVDALAVAMNTAFIINAANEKFKVLITYYQKDGDTNPNASSVRLQNIQRIQ
jgi:hypothetical protein